MGHWCWGCGCILPNEYFSGKGHARHICKECSRRPKDELQEIQDREFMVRVLEQKYISSKNILMLKSIQRRYSGELEKQAKVILTVAKLRPYRKKRYGVLYHNHRELFDQLVSLGIIEDYITPLREEAFIPFRETDASAEPEDDCNDQEMKVTFKKRFDSDDMDLPF